MTRIARTVREPDEKLTAMVHIRTFGTSVAGELISSARCVTTSRHEKVKPIHADHAGDAVGPARCVEDAGEERACRHSLLSHGEESYEDGEDGQTAEA